MDEDSGVKAPVTRLRRRLSVEQTEEKPSTPNTPTKKRATRRGKPELDLIDENVVPDTSKRTARKTAKELEPVEEKCLTPSRRSTRIKSNTSIISEVAAPISVDSPRAKRAARRTSHLDSDSEATNTPTRQTRRTRKDSTSSIEKVNAVEKPAIQITETISEEPETVLRKSSSNDLLNNSPQNNLRKSPRLNKSVENTSVSTKPNENSTSPLLKKDSNVDEHSSLENNSTLAANLLATTQNNDKPEDDNIDNLLSVSTKNLINILDKETPQKKNVHNKSTSALERGNFKSKKKRTKSWSTVCSPNQTESTFYSDNESKKNKLNSLKSPLLHSNNKASSDEKHDLNVSGSKVTSNMSYDKSALLNEIEESKSKANFINKNNTSSEELFNREPSAVLKPVIVIEDSDSNPESGSKKEYSNEDQCVPVVSMSVNLNKTIPDQDNHNKSNKNNMSNSTVNEINKETLNESVEPMDIDETISDNIILLVSEPNISEKNHSKIQQDSEIHSKSNRKSLSHSLDKTEDKSRKSFSHSVDKTEDKSRNSLSRSMDKTEDKSRKSLSHSLDKSRKSLSRSMDKTEDKSTMIISEIKDISTNAINQSEKNQITSKYDKSLSKSAVDLDKTQNNEIDSKNASLTCLTSTPLQQRNFQKLVAPINTSIIKHNQDTVTSPSIQNTSKDKSNVESSEDESSEEESSKEKNELLDCEASDAGDDYESGDSQDEEERQCAEENEIVDKGVTLTSDEELSNDSDYEKDSFVVSSDEEDKQLLDGTNDDLSMSDNELKMSARSKKKYNERMAKEQKKASREMFEARHKLDNSKEGQTKESDSTDSSEEESAPIKITKKNRMRLDSSHETSVLSNENTPKVHKKTKRLSESVCNESVLNEKEITMHNDSLQESDPLATQIKQEPKTPKNYMNSTMDFVDANDAKNATINKSIENENIADPLHTTMNEEMSSSDNDSDTNNIIDNYDSILNELNKTEKAKNSDISLNLEINNKKKIKRASVIDELNLTQVKTDLKNLKPELSNKKSEKVMKITKGKHSLAKDSPNRLDSSSDYSIDLNLLFSEESNNDSNSNVAEGDEYAIPLKESEAKTDIRENEGHDEADGSINFFIDTHGEHSNEDSACHGEEQMLFCTDNDQSIKSSAKKKKKKMLSQSLLNELPDEPAEEITREENKLSLSFEQNKSNVKTPKSEKKKKRDSNSLSHSTTEEMAVKNDGNISTLKTPKSEKKKKKHLSESQTEGTSDNVEAISQGYDDSMSNIKTPNSEKKKNKRVSGSVTSNLAEISTGAVTGTEVADISTSKTPKSEKKKKKRLSESQTDITSDISTGAVTGTEIANISTSKTPKSEKKKKKLHSESQTDITSEKEIQTEEIAVNDVDTSTLKSPKSEKKKKKRLSESQTDGTSEQEALIKDMAIVNDGDSSTLKTPKSEKKKKKRLSESQTDVKSGIPTEELAIKQDSDISLIKTPKSDKKKKKRQSESQTNNITAENSDSDCPLEVAVQMNQPNTENEDEVTKKLSAKKKNKKKSKLQSAQKSGEVIVNSEDSSSQKRKRPIEFIEELTEDIESSNRQKKIKIFNSEKEMFPAPEDGKTNKNKKRKQREDDDVGVTKVRKTNTLGKIPVPRLPSSIISQLDDKPKLQTKKKPKVIATSQFVIEEVNRNKPSKYLEESFYLHEASPKKKKPKANIQKPKVLPTIPTASTSNTGYTTNFKVNVLPRETQFVAQKSNIANFREERMYNKSIKRVGTYEMYKRQRNMKLSKF